MIETAILEKIRSHWPDLMPHFTEQARRDVNGAPSWICPLCGHGKGGDGLTAVPNTAVLKCFGCGATGDIIHFYRLSRGLGYHQACTELASLCGIVDVYPDCRSSQKIGPFVHTTLSSTGRHTPLPAAADFERYLGTCRQALLCSQPARAYLAWRGISLETASAAGVGFDAAADPACAPAGLGVPRHPVPRIIIPCGTRCYSARALDPSCPYPKLQPKSGVAGLFNAGALDTPEGAVFVCEGAFDALACLECGQPALALNSVANVRLLLEVLDKKPLSPRATLVLALDQDAAGKQAADTLSRALTARQIRFLTADLSGGCKDPSAALQADRQAFEKRLVKAAAHCCPCHYSVVQYFQAGRFETDLQNLSAVMPTGFDQLDEQLAGGLRPGLYVLAAISGLGKTTFALQLASQLAEHGTYTLFYSMEMSRAELGSKLLAMVHNRTENAALLTAAEIRQPVCRTQRQEAVSRLQDRCGQRLSLLEAEGDCTPGKIKDIAGAWQPQTSCRQLAIIIDYLQVMQPDPGASGISCGDRRERLDRTIIALRQLSRDTAAAVFVISSINRAAYLGPVSFEALKETGCIEYTADVVYGMQLHVCEEPKFISQLGQSCTYGCRRMLQQALLRCPRTIDLHCLKNRFGKANEYMCFDYNPAAEYFTERPDRRCSCGQ